MQKKPHYPKLASLSIAVLLSLTIFSPHLHASSYSNCINYCRHNVDKCVVKHGFQSNIVIEDMIKNYCKNNKENFNATLM